MQPRISSEFFLANLLRIRVLELVELAAGLEFLPSWRKNFLIPLVTSSPSSFWLVDNDSGLLPECETEENHENTTHSSDRPWD